MWSNNKTAVYCLTRRLYPFLSASVKSIVANSDVDDIWLLIEDDEMPEEIGIPETDFIHTRNVSNQKYFDWNGPNMKSGFTYMAMMRAALIYEFPELDRILSLDVDTFAVKDISPLWNLPLEDKYYFSAVDEVDTSFRLSKEKGFKFLSTNVGVWLQNLKKLRDGTADKAIKRLNTTYDFFLEQNTFNELCQGAIYEMPCKYNVSRYSKSTDDPRIFHYVAYPDWSDKPKFIEWSKVDWDTVLNKRKEFYNK